MSRPGQYLAEGYMEGPKDVYLVQGIHKHPIVMISHERSSSPLLVSST